MLLAAGTVGAIAGYVFMVACPGLWAAPVHACTHLHHINYTAVQAPVYTPDVLLHRETASLGMTPAIHLDSSGLIPTPSPSERCAV